MKLHLPSGLRAALFACFAAFAGIGTTLSTATITGGVFAVTLAGAVAQAEVTYVETSTTNSYEGSIAEGYTFAGAIYTQTASGDVGLDSDSTVYTELNGTTETENVTGTVYEHFIDDGDAELGYTLRLSATGYKKIPSSATRIVLGGLIVESGLDGYGFGRISNVNTAQADIVFRAATGEGMPGANMVIGSNYHLFTAHDTSKAVIAETGGDWSVAAGKTLYFSAKTTSSRTKVIIEDDQTVNLKNISVTSAGEGANLDDIAVATFQMGALTVDTGAVLNIGKRVVVGVTSDTITGSVVNDGTLNVSGTSVIAGSLTNNGTLTATGVATINGTLTNAGTMTLSSALSFGEGGKLTNSGELTLNGGGTLTSSIVNNGTLTLAGTVVANSYANNGTVVLGSGLTFDLSSLTAAVSDDQKTYTYTLFTGEDVDLSTLTIDSIITAADGPLAVKEAADWTFGKDGTIKAVITGSSLEWTSGDPLNWGVGTPFTTGGDYADGDVVSLNTGSPLAVTLMSDVTPAQTTIEAGTDVTIASAQNQSYKIGGKMIVHGSLVLDGDVLANTFHVTDDGAGAVTLNVGTATVNSSVFATGYTGAVTMESGRLIATEDRTSTSFSSLTVQDGAQFSMEGWSYTGNMALSGSGVAGAGVDDTEYAALRLGNGTLRGTLSVTGDTVIRSTSTAYILSALSGSGTLRTDVTTGTLTLEGNVTHSGSLVVSGAGMLSFGNNSGSHTNSINFSDITVESGATLRLAHSTLNTTADVTLNGGMLYSDEIGGTHVATFGALTVAGEGSMIRERSTGILRFDSLSGSADLAIELTNRHGGGQEVDFATVKDYQGTVSMTTSGQGTFTYFHFRLGTVDQAEGYTMTVTGRAVESQNFVKDGHGALDAQAGLSVSASLAMKAGTLTTTTLTSNGSFAMSGGTLTATALTSSGSFAMSGGTLTATALNVSGILNMNYGGALSYDTLSIADGTVLRYDKTIGSQLINIASLGTGEDAVSVAIDVFDVLSELESDSGIKLGISTAVDKSLIDLSSLGSAYTADNLVSNTDGSWYLKGTVASIKTDWDLNWGSGLTGQPTSMTPITLPVATIALADDVYYSSANKNASILIAGTSQEGAIVYGGSSCENATTERTLEADTWIQATGGDFRFIVGGNNCATWDAGGAIQFVGNSHILLKTGTVTAEDGTTTTTTPVAEYIIGGNYKDGFGADFTGSSYITLESNSLQGALVGGSVQAHNQSVTYFTGNSHIFIYTPQTLAADSDFQTEKVGALDAIIGGSAEIGWNSGTLRFTGDSSILLDFADYNAEATMAKEIVGGSYSAGEQYDDDGAVVGADSKTNIEFVGNSSITIRNASTTTFTKDIVGASKQGAVSNFSGTASIDISSGTYTGMIVGGHYVSTAAGAATCTLGAAELTLSGGTYQGNIYAAGYLDRSNSTMETGSTTVTIGTNATLGTDSAAITVSGGYGGSTASGGTVQGDRTLNIGTGSYSNAVFRDFDVVNTAGDVSLGLVAGTSLTKNGSGKLTMTDGGGENRASSLASLTVTEGTFDGGVAWFKNGGNGLTSISIGAGAQVSLTAVALADGASLALDLTGATASSAAMLKAMGTDSGVWGTSGLNLLGSVNLTLDGLDSLATDTAYTLLEWQDSKDVELSKFLLDTTGLADPSLYELAIDGNTLVLKVGTVVDSWIWSDADGGFWGDVASWGQTGDTPDGKALTFGDAVFSDTVTSCTVTLSGQVTPASVLVTPAAGHTYVFTGDGGIASGAVEMNGAGTLVLATTNSSTDTLTITQGTVQLGNATAAADGTTSFVGGSWAGAVVNNAALTVAADSSIASYDTTSTGTISVADAATLTIGSTSADMNLDQVMALLSAGDASASGMGGTIAVTNKGSYWSSVLLDGTHALTNGVDVDAHYAFNTNVNIQPDSALSLRVTNNGSLNLNDGQNDKNLILYKNVNLSVAGGALTAGEVYYGEGGGATLSLSSGSITAKFIKLQNADDATFEMTGGTLSLAEYLDGSSAKSVSITGGTLATSDADGWSMSGDVTLGAVTIDAANAGTISVTGTATFVDQVVNNGKLSLTGTIVVDDASLANFGPVSSNIPTDTNGFADAVYCLVAGATGSTLTVTATEATMSSGGTGKLDDDGSSLYFTTEGLSGLYYVNVDTVTYGGESSEMPIANVTGLVLNGGALALASDLDAAATDGIIVQQDATINLAEGVTLAGSSITSAADKKVTLAGSGTYEATTQAELAVSGLSSWSGTLHMNGVVLTAADPDLGDYGNANSTIEMTGVSGNVRIYSGVSADLVLNAVDDTNTAGLKITGGTSTGTNTMYLRGTVSGDGDLVRAWDTTTAVGFAFSGDVSGWTGDFVQDSTSGSATSVSFTDSATTINAGLTQTSGGTLSVTVDNANAVAVNGAITGDVDVTYAGAGTKTVSNTASTYTGDTTISAGTVQLAAGVKSLGASVSVAENAVLQLQGNTLTGLAVSGAGTLQVAGASSVASLADTKLELGSTLGVTGAVSGLTSLTVTDTLAGIISSTDALLTADTIALGSELTLNIASSLLNSAEGGEFVILGSGAAIDLTASTLKLAVTGDNVTVTNDTKVVIGQITYTLGLSATDNTKLVLTGAFDAAFDWEDDATAGQEGSWVGGTGDTSSGDGWLDDSGNPTTPGSDAIVSFTGSDTIHIDTSAGDIEVAGLRVETTDADGYTFTGANGDGSDTLTAGSLVVAQGDLTVDTLTLVSDEIVVGQSTGTKATLEVGTVVTDAEGNTTISEAVVNTNELVVNTGATVVVNEGSTLNVLGALKTEDGVSITNTGTIAMGMGSSVGTITGVKDAEGNVVTGTIEARTGTVSIDTVQGEVAGLLVGRSAVVTVGSDLTVDTLTSAGAVKLTSTDANGDAQYHDLTITSEKAVTAGGTMTAASVDLSGVGAEVTVDGETTFVAATGNSFTALTTDKITLNVESLTPGGAALLHVNDLTQLTQVQTFDLDGNGGIELELTGIPTGADGIDAALAANATQALAWAEGFAAGSYTLLSYGTLLGDLNLVTPSITELQQIFALADMDAKFTTTTANGITSVTLTLTEATDREWVSTDPTWAGKEDEDGYKLGIDLDPNRTTLMVATYDKFDTVDKVTLKGTSATDTINISLAGETMDAAKAGEGLVIRDLNGTGTLVLTGDGIYDATNLASGDLVTIINTQADRVLNGSLKADKVTVQVTGTTDAASLTVTDITLTDAELVVQDKGDLTSTGTTSLTNSSATVEKGGALETAATTLTDSELTVKNGGELTVTGETTLASTTGSATPSTLTVEAGGTLNAGAVKLTGENTKLDNDSTQATVGAVTLSGTGATLDNSGTLNAGAVTLSGTDNVLTNDGTLAMGTHALNVAASASNAQLTNNGTLTTTGGVTLDGTNTSLTNNGTLDVGALELKSDTASFTSAAGADTTVDALNGTAGTVAGLIKVDSVGGNYSGNYGANTEIQLGSAASQQLALSNGAGSANLSISAPVAGAKVTLDVADGGATIAALNTVGADITLLNNGTNGSSTLTVADPTSTVNGGSLSFSVNTANVAAGGKDVVTTGLNIVGGTQVVVQAGAAAPDVTFDVTRGTDGWSLFTLTNGNVENAQVLLDPNNAFFTRYFDPNSVRVENGVVKADLITDYYTSRLAETENGAAGMQMLDMAELQVNPQEGDLSDVLASLDQYVVTGDSGAADKLAAAVAGSGVASLGMAIAGDVERQLKAIRNRTTTMGVDPSVVNEDMPYFNAWINAEGDHRSMDQDSTMAGYKLNSWGGTVGFDVDVNPSLTFGLALTAMYGDFSAESADVVEGDVDTYYVSAFARGTSGAWVHTFVATMGMSRADIERTVSHAHGSYSTDGETDGLSFGALYEVARTFALNEDATACWQPVFNVAYRHTLVEGYAETGSDAALRVGDQTLDTVTFGLGGRLQAVVGENIYNRTSVFEARALAKLDAGDRQSEMDTALQAASAATGRVKSAEMGAFGVELGAGLTVPVGMESGSIFLDASVELRDAYINANGTVGYRINF